MFIGILIGIETDWMLKCERYTERADERIERDPAYQPSYCDDEW